MRNSIFVFFKAYIFKLLNIRVNSPNSGCLPNSGFRPVYTIMSHFAAYGPIRDRWAALRPISDI